MVSHGDGGRSAGAATAARVSAVGRDLRQPGEGLLSASEIASMLRVPGEDLVVRWSRHCPDFPTPVVRIPSPRWAQEDVERWAQSWGWRG